MKNNIVRQAHNKGIAPIIIVLIIAVLAGGGYAAYKIAQKSGFVGGSGKSDIIQPGLLGGDRDAHGCIGSAGYSWCEVKQKCLRVWEEKCEVTTIAPLTVISPNGRENYIAGNAMNIKWISNIMEPHLININLSRVEETQTIPVARGIQDTGSYLWTIPSNLGLGSFKIIVSVPNAQGVDSIENKNADASDIAFTIAR